MQADERAIVAEIEKRFDNARRIRDEMTGKVRLLEKQAVELEDAIEVGKADYETLNKTLDVLRKYALIRESVLKQRIDSVVTMGLRLIFGPGYRSRLEFGISRGQAVVRSKIISSIDGVEFEADVADAHGGGIVNIVSVIYQVLVLCLMKPRQRRVLFLDEPFRNVSAQHIEAAGEFLKQLNEKLGVQIVIITHHEQTKAIADKVYDFRLVNGVTEVKEMSVEQSA